MDIKFRQTLWLLGRNSKLSLNHKLSPYRVVLKPIWSYGVQLWGCAKPTRLKPIQRFQSKRLRTIVNAPWCVSNKLLHNDLHIPNITDEIRRVAIRYNDKTHSHANDRIEHLYHNGLTDKTASQLACGPRTALKRCPMRSDGGLPRKSPPPLATHSLSRPIARRCLLCS